MGASILTALYDLADMFWVSKLGTEAIAGVTVAMSLYWFGAIFNDLFGTPSVILFARRYGEKDQEGMQKIFSQTILLKLTFAITFVLLAFTFRKTLLSLLGSDGQALEAAVDFFSARVWFMPIAFASFTINSAFRSSGDVSRFARLQLIATIFNIIFDPILIFVCKLGVAGAAIATGIADTIVLTVGLYWLTTGKSRVQLTIFHSIKPDWKIIKTMFRLGAPTIIDSGSNHFIGLLVIRILNFYGVIVVAAWGLLGRIRTVLFMVSFALEMAVSTLVGQNLGAGYKDRAKEAAFAGIRIDMLLIGAYGIVMAIFAPWVIAVFQNDPEIISMGTTFIRIMAIGDIFFAGYMACLGAISGAGETRINMAISLASNWLILMPGLLILTYLLKAPATWLPWAYALNNLTLFTLSFLVIRGERWLMRDL